MIPTDVALQWIAALEFGLIDETMDARTMREKVRPVQSRHLTSTDSIPIFVHFSWPGKPRVRRTFR